MEKVKVPGLTLLIMLFVIITNSCQKYEVAVLNVKVIDSFYGIDLENVEVAVLMRKPWFMKYKTIATFSRRTNAKGECSIVILDYYPEKFN